jgi:hypothetical protein
MSDAVDQLAQALRDLIHEAIQGTVERSQVRVSLDDQLDRLGSPVVIRRIPQRFVMLLGQVLEGFQERAQLRAIFLANPRLTFATDLRCPWPLAGRSVESEGGRGERSSIRFRLRRSCLNYHDPGDTGVGRGSRSCWGPRLIA